MKPCGRPAGPAVVTTVTPLAQWLITSLKSFISRVCLSTGVDMPGLPQDHIPMILYDEIRRPVTIIRRRCGPAQLHTDSRPG
ncbi:hypothetical protein EASAB2608_07121 [Streptomyces sp. EAS-AB2608]|nr:hypothetical protein EASAB2608_07121 [Streptomyces sp. EAS-AB2608]